LIRQLADARTVDVFEGFAANKATVTSAPLARYGLLHFATHAVTSSEFPELTGLVLSTVDEHGKDIDGLLHLQEIYSLRLDAQLVVLSACSTALGRSVRGEGPLSLGRAFLFAGARRVVTTQWRVADDVAPELMKRFYSALLKDGVAPAEALREAQLEIAAQAQWRHPFFWAGWALTSSGVN
jgi:CHAT domain-containing protein